MKILLATLVLFSFSSNAQNCQDLYQQHLKTDLALSYKEFDQTMGQGFRALLKDGLNCHKEVAQLIEKYIEVNNATQSSLRWHAAQSWGHAGDYKKAVKWSKTVPKNSENFEENALRWNDFVLGNIAFFEKDKETLTQHRDKVAAAKDNHFGNQLNTKFLDSLIKNFNESYHYAVNHIEQ
ncbi:hypothetical protein [Marinicella gelatinilytica]|uniref:hypothetical protein n=1 Tax=Marinicella gelatinilytica TaxID=2996017 RepID=UPI002260D6D1|nr:hypothetical protein [Marinicella gelatinilytica]MCX7545147.1 hypothetical protein [Marinicella gelatinilytica]